MKREDEFERILRRAQMADKNAMVKIVEIYRPLLVSHAKIRGKFEEDLYQELVYTTLKCIFKFPLEKAKRESTVAALYSVQTCVRQG